MAYPGNPELSPRAQERVMSAFRLVIRNLQDDRKDEAVVGLDFVLRLDPDFSPALVLQEQLSSGDGSVSLEALLAEINAPMTEEINLLLVDAIEDFEKHHYLEAKEKVQRVLMELPGHEDARNLSRQIEEAMEKEAQVGHFLAQAREALDAGDPQEASNFVLMAQALDPHHPGIHPTLVEIQQKGQELLGQVEQPPVEIPEPEEVQEWKTQQVAMPESFELEDAVPETAAVDFSPEPEPAAGGFATESEKEDESFPSDFFTESGSVGDLFEDLAAPENAEAFLDVAPEPDAGISSEPEPEVSDAYAAGADNWKTDALSSSEVSSEEPEAGKQEEGEDSWGPEFDSLGGDVSDLFSSDSSADLVMDEEWDLSAGTAAEAVSEVEESVPETLPPVPDSVGEDFEDNFQDDFSIAEAGQEPDEEIPGEGMASAPGGEEDLFDDDFSVSAEIDAIESRSRKVAEGPPSRNIPWQMILFGAAAVIIVLGGMWLGMKMMSSGDSDEDRARVVQKLLNDADSLLSQGKAEEALHLLESFQADEIEQARIDKHIEQIHKAMAPPTPTPVPQEAVNARSLLDKDDWFGALVEVQKGLDAAPGDPGLLDLKDEISRIDSQVLPLFRAMERKDYRTIASLGLELERAYPGQTQLHKLVNRSLFNAAIHELRNYNLTGARQLLLELQDRKPDDAEVTRILKVVAKYVKKPVDMQLQIFVGSIEER